jgi:hypothetical protein
MLDLKTISEIVKNNLVVLLIGIVTGVSAISSAIRQQIPYPYPRDLVLIAALAYVYFCVARYVWFIPISRKLRALVPAIPIRNFQLVFATSGFAILISSLCTILFGVVIFWSFPKTFRHLPIPGEWQRCLRIESNCRSSCPGFSDASGESVGLDCVSFKDDAGRIEPSSSQYLYYEPVKLKMNCGGGEQSVLIPEKKETTTCELVSLP